MKTFRKGRLPYANPQDLHKRRVYRVVKGSIVESSGSLLRSMFYERRLPRGTQQINSLLIYKIENSGLSIDKFYASFPHIFKFKGRLRSRYDHIVWCGSDENLHCRSVYLRLS